MGSLLLGIILVCTCNPMGWKKKIDCKKNSGDSATLYLNSLNWIKEISCLGFEKWNLISKNISKKVSSFYLQLEEIWC